MIQFKNIKDKIWAYIGLLFVALIVGSSLIFIKVGLKYSDPIDLLAYRYTTALLSVLVLCILGIIKLPKLTVQKAKRLGLIAVFYPVSFFFFQAYGLDCTTVSETAIVLSLVPIFTLIVATVFLKEKNSFWQKVGIVLSVLGILYIMFQKGVCFANLVNVKGIFILFVALGAMVLYYVLGKFVMQQFMPIELTVWMIIFAFFAFNAFSISNHLMDGTMLQFFEVILNQEFLISILYLGVLSSVLTSFLTNYALSIVPASQVSVFNNLSPIVSITLGLVILNEQLYRYHFIGGALVLIGIVLTLFSRTKL